MRIFLGISLLATLWTTVDANQFSISKDFNVLQVNGENFKSKFWGKKHDIKLENGPQTIELEYEAFYDVGYDNHEKITSQPFIIRFNCTGADLEVIYSKPDQRELAKEYALAPRFKIVTSAEKLEIPVEFLTSEASARTGLLGFLKQSPTGESAHKKAVEADENKKVEQDKYAKPTETDGAKAKNLDACANLSTSPALEKVNNQAPLEELRLWWKKASLEERQTFMREILQ